MKTTCFLVSIITVFILIIVGCNDDETSPVQPENNAPVIQNVAADPDLIAIGETTMLICTASDEDNDTLAYNWAASDGTFPNQSAGASVIWQAPDVSGDYTISITVSDGEDTIDGSITVCVTIHPPNGMVLIRAKNKSFRMGSDRFPDTFPSEQPVHTVSFTYNFWMDITEVTQGDFDSLMNYAYSNYFTPPWNWPYGLGDDYPVYEINWYDAVLYCNARSRRDGLDTVYTYTTINGTPGSLCLLEGVSADLSKNGYRLPTEAEWEYACRADSETDYYWGKNYDPYPVNATDTTEINSYAIWYGNSWQLGSESEQFGTQPVASKEPNAYGLYDMIGNLYEFVNDWYGEYSPDPVTDPIGPDTGPYHFLRGGCWGNYAEYIRAPNRTFDHPDYEFYFKGFRVVLK
ncbi:MAG: SUMF1/EgtB/PvdO family nonheme iron enzyme [Candidatus Hatepunaea meridiana]|nr:SUMF1/EgtB/PvdO family nonheme iron enzyme [Candidatus Hatepunaea meridiana]